MKKKAIGIMSGTSLDAVDIVLCEIEGSYLETQIKELAFKSYSFDEELKHKTLQAISLENASAKDLCSLNFELGYLFADCVNQFLNEHSLTSDEIDFIASHGQTIYHIPQDEKNHIRSTLQLGDGSIISSKTGITTVSNFRTADMALGGQGAPLVPYAEFLMYRDKNKNRAMHNLGGISNLTILNRDCSEASVLAFDTGPANMMIDYSMQQLYHLPYDQNGATARKGQLIRSMYDQIMSKSYFNECPPKSTGRELFGNLYTKSLIDQYMNHKKEDIIHTLTKVTANSIIEAYERFVLKNTPLDEIIFAGGGAYNTYLMELIQTGLPNIKIMRLEDLGFNSQSKEATAFVVLGNETLNGHYNHLLKATGATTYGILGQISPVYKKVKS
ncbi:Anhydro-N-acetylmuramic acid kinase [Paracholeplasma brassicae]|uniref:Anhydro-N-acetylmuramic acid kinase n=1 Tax=Acholeplasma brassicae TaxID=61635 RepID=U4KSR5_9MOLU|nr:anhydro-N-acetylmuramic acid kinase AnmK [Paracholeplasma brassicae]CCV65399.1 Anhydro-N-acetylmuramic acid kinase [Paracholeplasma brassicae]